MINANQSGNAYDLFYATVPRSYWTAPFVVQQRKKTSTGEMSMHATAIPAPFGMVQENCWIYTC